MDRRSFYRNLIGLLGNKELKSIVSDYKLQTGLNIIYRFNFLSN